MEKQKFSARVKQAIGEASITNLYQLNGMVPVHKAIPFGLQHILAMFVANIAPILIVGGACGLAASDMAMLIQSAMLIAGIGTLVQLFPIFHKIGSGLPIVMGISFTFVSVLCFIGAQYGYGAIMGAVLIGGIVEGILGLFAKFWIRIIAPIVSASVVTSRSRPEAASAEVSPMVSVADTRKISTTDKIASAWNSMRNGIRWGTAMIEVSRRAEKSTFPINTARI